MSQNYNQQRQKTSSTFNSQTEMRTNGTFEQTKKSFSNNYPSVYPNMFDSHLLKPHPYKNNLSFSQFHRDLPRDMLTMSTTPNSLTEFDRRSSSSPNQTASSIKQQPFSPPPYHPLSNGFYGNHQQQQHQHHSHHHQHHRHNSLHETSTPSPDHEQISPTVNRMAETSGSSGTQGSTMNAAPVSPDEKRRCAVCNDIASGYHYGVWSCEGCKAFFKRSIQGTNEYICPATNTCTIDKHRRKSCQACRLRRCYEVGMTKGTTRRERKYRKKAVSECKITSTSSNSNATNKTTVNNPEHANSVTTAQPQTGTSQGAASLAPTASINNTTANNSFQSSNKTTSDPTRIPMSSGEFLATLSQASRLNLPAKVDTSRPLDDQYFLQLLAKIFDQELVVLINWAKAMPGYTESLTLDQQVTIIEQSWLDTLLIDIIERSVERNDDSLHLAPDLIISKNRDLSSPGLGSICTNLFNIVQVFRDPRTTHDEFIALKATTLINSVPTKINSTKSFRLLTNQVYQSIQYACDSNPSVYHDNYVRHFTLLLQLPHIKMLSTKLIRLFIEMRANDLLPQADLLLEMLDAQDSFENNASFLSFNNEMNNLNSRITSFSQNSSNMNNGIPLSARSPTPNMISKNPSMYSYNAKNDETMPEAMDESDGKIDPRTTPSPLIYASRKHSTSPSSYNYQKHSRTDGTASVNMHFPMNNLSY